jgi:A/G-specific adenine glycosylase
MMLQQTQAERVAPAFERFLRRFPTVRDLAEAPRAEVLRVWAGLGYNRRALALSEAARRIVYEHAGEVPGDPGVLRRLPGVGPYTAAAVASLAHGVPVAAVDTNVSRVVARVRMGREAHTSAPRAILEHAERWLHRDDPGAWNQAIMDLGREICRPTPRCDVCPLAAWCRFRLEGRRPEHMSRRQKRFEGSDRQVRGAVIRELGSRRSAATIAGLSARSGHPPDRVGAAVASLASDGLVTAGPAALLGRPGGRVSLPD